MKTPVFVRAFTFLLAFSISSGVRSQPAYFCVNGGLLAFDGTESRSITTRQKGGEPVRIHRYWGTFLSRPVVTVEASAPRESDAPGASGVACEAKPLALLDDQGQVERVLANEVVRAFPSPDGLALAYVTADRRCLIRRRDTTTTLSIEGRVSHVAWSPDCTKLAVVVYPEDWSPTAVNNARTTDDFFRLQTSRILLFDVISLAPLATVVENDGTNYNPFFSSDSTELFYIHLDLMDDRGGVRKLALADVGTTTGELVIPTGERAVPLGRVGTYLWLGSRLIFEAGTPEGGGVLWTVTPDGKDARSLATGRYAQKLTDGRIVYLRTDSRPAVLELSRTEESQR